MLSGIEVDVTADAPAPPDGQRVELGMVYRLESAVMPYAVWNGERFVGPRERFHLRLLEAITRAQGGWVQLIGGPINGAPLVAEINTAHCAVCNGEERPTCESRGHTIIDEAIPNRALLAAIDEITAPLLEAEAEARAADDVDEILIRAYRWQSRHGIAYVPSLYETRALQRRLNQLADDESQRLVIEKRFPIVASAWHNDRHHRE